MDLLSAYKKKPFALAREGLCVQVDTEELCLLAAIESGKEQ